MNQLLENISQDFRAKSVDSAFYPISGCYTALLLVKH